MPRGPLEYGSVEGPLPASVDELPHNCPFTATSAIRFTGKRRRKSSGDARQVAVRWLVDVGLVPGYAPLVDTRAPVPVCLPTQKQAGLGWSRFPNRLRKSMPAAILVHLERWKHDAYVAFAGRTMTKIDGRIAELGRKGIWALGSAPWMLDGDRWVAAPPIGEREVEAMEIAQRRGFVVLEGDSVKLLDEGERAVRAMGSRRLAHRQRAQRGVHVNTRERRKRARLLAAGVKERPCVMCGMHALAGGWCPSCVRWMHASAGVLRLCGMRPGRWRVYAPGGAATVTLEHPGEAIAWLPSAVVRPVDYQARLLDELLRA